MAPYIKYFGIFLWILVLFTSSIIHSVSAVGDDYQENTYFGTVVPSFTHDISNLLIYTLSKERKRDDGETYESWLAAVVHDILTQSDIRGAIVGCRILNVFKKKISTMYSALKRATKSGGKSVKRLMNVWEVGSKYRFTIFYNELDVVNIEHENKKLKGEKRKLEQSLEEETCKRMRTEEQLNAVTNLAESNNGKYKKKFKQLGNKVAKLSSNKKTRGPDKKKQFTEYSMKHQARVRKQLKEQSQTALSFLGHYNFVPSKIELYNYETGAADSFTFTENDEFLLAEAEGNITETETDNLNMWLYIKDKFHISNEAWREIALKSDDSPCLNKIIKHMKKLNQKWEVKATPGKAEGENFRYFDCTIDNGT